jgi:hypothetical protein
LKNSDYSAAVSAVRILLSPLPKLLILQDFWFGRPGFEITGHLRGFGAMPIGHPVRRDRFRTAVVGETGQLSLLAIDVVEYQN